MTKHEQKIVIESLAMDLKRVAVGYQRGSLNMAHRFAQEALKREGELEANQMGDYLKKLVANSKKLLLQRHVQTGEDILMYSTLFQNFAQKMF